MLTHIARSLLASVALFAFGGVASADVLFQNPDPFPSLPPGNTSGTPGNVDAWTINHGFSVSDSFSLSTNSTATSVDFLAWLPSRSPRDTITALDWTISSDPGGAGTIFGSGINTSVSAVFQNINIMQFDLDLATFSLGSLNLSSGTYWLTLQNAVASNIDLAYWDQGGGTSNAWQSAEGILLQENGTCGATEQAPTTNGSCAETFRINGTAATGVPEPITLSLFGVGLAGAVAMRRRKTKKD